MCEYGSVYKPCGPPCEETCQNIGEEVEDYCEATHCVEGCFCPNGTYRQGRNIVIVCHVLFLVSIGLLQTAHLWANTGVVQRVVLL